MYKKSPITVMVFLAAWVLFSAVSACRPPGGQPPGPPPESPATAAPPADEQPGKKGYIDVHMHLDGQSRSGGALAGGYETAAEKMTALTDQYGVAKALVMPPPQQPGQRGAYDYQDLLGAVRENSGKLYLVAGGGTLNPLIIGTEESKVTDELRAKFEEQANAIITDGAVAFGEMAALHLCLDKTHHFIAASPDHPLLLLLADIAARHNVPIDMHMEAVIEDMPPPSNLAQACDKNPAVLPATIPAFERLLAHNREAKIVWQHIGWDNTGDMTIELIRGLLNTHPNLYLALKIEAREVQVQSRDPMPNRIVDRSGNIQAEWLQLLGDYPDRFIIGADEFVGVSGRATHGAESFSQTWAILNQLPADLAQKVGHDNAARIYNLD